MPTTAPSYNCIPSSELTYNKAKDCYTWPSGESKKRIGNSTTSGHYRAFIYRTQASGYYKLRQQVIEHQFGILKRQWGFAFTLLKGMVNVLTGVNLLIMIYNLKRTISIIGIDESRKKVNTIMTICFLSYAKVIEAILVSLCGIENSQMNFLKPKYQVI